MASIAPTFQGFPVSSIRMSAMLFEREQGDGQDAKRQADELGAGRLFLVDERSDQHGEDRRNDREEHRAFTELQADTQADQYSANSREHRKEHCTFAQFRTCTQADEPGRVGHDEAEDREDGKNELSVQSELLRQDVCNQLKDYEQQKKVKPPGW